MNDFSPPLRGLFTRFAMAGLLTLYCIGMCAAALAQGFTLNALPTPNVELTRPGRVLEMERLPDGKLLLAGEFIRIGGQPRANIARLNASGNLDTSYVANIDVGSGLQQLLTDGNGRTYVLTGSSLRRLAVGGTLDTAFATVFFNFTLARSLALVSDGIIVGGNFSTVGTPELPRAGLVKIRLDGSVDPNFIVTTNEVTTVLSSGADEVLVGGGFTSIGGNARTGLARVSTIGTGTVLTTWNPNLTTTSGNVRIFDALIHSGALYIAGTFDAVGATPRARLAKLSMASGAALDSAWNVSAPALSNARLFQHNNSLLVSTFNFASYANPPSAAVSARRLMRAALSGSGNIDASFAPTFNADVFADPVAVTDGDAVARMVIGGNFLSIGSTSRFALAQLNADGSLDSVSALTEAINVGNVAQLQIDPSTQRTYLSGSFLRADGAALRYCLRLNANGLVDTNWRPQTDDRVSPAFAHIPGAGVWVATNAGIARLNEIDGLRISSWVNSTINVSQLIATNNAVYALTPNAIVRFAITSNGLGDPGFVLTTNASIQQLRFDAAGNTIVFSGAFSQVNGVNRPRLARIDANTGALLTSFDPNFADDVGVMGVQGFDLDGAGAVWAAGNFVSVNGSARQSPVRLLLSNGDIDPASVAPASAAFNVGLGFHGGFFYGLRFTFNGNAQLRRVPSAGGEFDPSWLIATNSAVNAVAFDANRVLLGGDFQTIGNTARLALASVPKTDAVFQNGFD